MTRTRRILPRPARGSPHRLALARHIRHARSGRPALTAALLAQFAERLGPRYSERAAEASDLLELQARGIPTLGKGPDWQRRQTLAALRIAAAPWRRVRPSDTPLPVIDTGRGLWVWEVEHGGVAGPWWVWANADGWRLYATPGALGEYPDHVPCELVSPDGDTIETWDRHLIPTLADLWRQYRRTCAEVLSLAEDIVTPWYLRGGDA